MPKPTSQKKLLLRIGIETVLEAQGGVCPLCGIAEFDDKPESNGMSGHEKNYPSLPYYSATFDHVIPEAKGGRFFGNCLVVHNGCNSRKAKSLPLEHEIAALKIVNERLGWDGVTYANTEIGRMFYEHIERVLKHQGLERLIELTDKNPRVVSNFLLRRYGIEPSPPALVGALPPSEWFISRKRPMKPSKNVLSPQRRHGHLIIGSAVKS